MSVMIGIDPAKGSHAAAAVNGGEEVMAELEVRATRRQTSELLVWAERFPQRSWAIESANGHGYLLAQQLVSAGEHVVDVPSTLSARVRVLDSPIAEERRQRCPVGGDRGATQPRAASRERRGSRGGAAHARQAA